MSRPVAVLRPQPGNGETVARLAARGLDAIALPLFEVVPLAWQAPDPAAFDALILTSANTLRHGGPALDAFHKLPAHAVGQATAAAARAHGFGVMTVGTNGAAALIADVARQGFGRALHLGGRENTVVPSDIVRRTIAVYASEPADIDPARLAVLADTVAILHSPRAGTRLAALVDAARIDRSRIRLAAISAAAAAAAGTGWAMTMIAESPGDAALVDAAARLAD